MKLDNTGAATAFQRMDPASSDSTNYRWKNPMTMDENNDNVLYWSERNKIWRHNSLSSIPYNNSNDKSNFGWDFFSDSLQTQMDITTLNSSVNPPDILYFGTSSKYMYRIDNASVGDPPKSILTGPPTGSNSFTADIAINPLDANEIICVYSNYSVYSLFHSMDGGQSWEKIAGNLEETNTGSGNGPSCRTALIIPFDNDTLYLVGTTVGLYGTRELDGVNTIWQQIGFEEFGSTIVEDLTFRLSDNLLVVATYGNGVYQINLSSSNILLPNNEISSNNIDLKIYPNPAKDFINLSFNLTNEYRWIIYNELGAIVNQSRTKKSYGNTSEKIDISDLKAGVYFVFIINDDKVITKEFIK